MLAKLLAKGHSVSLPFGDNQRYDLILDEGGTLSRVQCKTGRIRNGAIRFNAHSVDGKSLKHRNYKNEIELFIVYCPDNEKFYKVPINSVGVGKPYLRVEPVRNGQASGVRLAKDFEF